MFSKAYLGNFQRISLKTVVTGMSTIRIQLLQFFLASKMILSIISVVLGYLLRGKLNHMTGKVVLKLGAVAPWGAARWRQEGRVEIIEH